MDKVSCRTPTPGKQPTAIPAWKFERVREAILAVVPDEEPGLAFQELTQAVADQLSDEDRDGLGSVGWHTTTVKLELEVRGELRRLEGPGPQRLVRTVA